MIEAHGVDHHEPGQVVLVGYVVPMPRNYVERRVREFARPQPAHEFGHHLAPTAILEGRDRHLKVPLLREPLRADGPELRQWETVAVVFAQVAARRLCGNLDPELNSARHDCNLAGS